MNSVERRCGRERRTYTVRSLWVCLIAPTRMQGRRSQDRREAILDRMDPGAACLAVLLMLFSIMDSLFTLMLISRGGTELNPFMLVLMEHSLWTFAAVKMLLTAIPAVILVATSRLTLFNRWRAGSVLAALVGLYMGLLAYELLLLSVS